MKWILLSLLILSSACLPRLCEAPDFYVHNSGICTNSHPITQDQFEEMMSLTMDFFEKNLLLDREEILAANGATLITLVNRTFYNCDEEGCDAYGTFHYRWNASGRIVDDYEIAVLYKTFDDCETLRVLGHELMHLYFTYFWGEPNHNEHFREFYKEQYGEIPTWAYDILEMDLIKKQFATMEECAYRSPKIH